jgi:hypothetical protein
VTPHHKSDNAKLAEGRGERVWTKWTLKLLIEEVLRLNERDVTEKDIRAVRSLEYIRVKVLEATEQHHVARRMPPPHNRRMAWYYRVDPKVARKLSSADVQRWSASRPDDAELDIQVKDKTGKVYHRSHRSH